MVTGSTDTSPDAIYQVLFSGTEEQNEKINLGMTETIMSLSLVGFGTTAENGAGIGCRLFRYAGEGVEKMISDTEEEGQHWMICS